MPETSLPGALVPGGRNRWIATGLVSFAAGGAFWCFGSLLLLGSMEVLDKPVDLSRFTGVLTVFGSGMLFVFPLLLLALYFWRGWLKTYFGLWPQRKAAPSAAGSRCRTCQGYGKPGREYAGRHLCDDCVRQRHRDNRLIVGCLVLTFGVIFVACSVMFFSGVELGRTDTGSLTVEWGYRSVLLSPVMQAILGLLGLALIFGGVRILTSPISPKDMEETGRSIALKL